MVGLKNQVEDVLEYGRGYSEDVDTIREREYPQLKDTTYLDHAGTTLYAKSLIESFSRDLTSNLFGNPHSMSASSQLSTRRVDDVRLRALRFFKADPDEFDLVFVANATAAIKLVADAMRDSSQGFWYGYHADAHTSLVGARELAANGNRCFSSDEEVEGWISGLRDAQPESLGLFAFPAQSNMNGRRLPLAWCKEIRNHSEAAGGNTYTLLDAASLVATSPLNLSDASAAPDFTVLSFYKIFGFPDLGALIVRKHAGHVFEQRRFFGGGTVDMVLIREMQWHAKKQSSIHDRLEDGTLPFHSIIALDAALATHERLFGSMGNVSSHTRFLARRLYDRLAALTHFNGEKVCHLYTPAPSEYTKSFSQGPIIALNLRNSHGAWIGKSEVERLAAVKNIQLRSGSLCNPGGTSRSLGWTGSELLQQFSAGLRCGDDHDVMDGRPTGVLRLSLGAMTNFKDIDTFIQFVEEFYVEKTATVESFITPVPNLPLQQPRFYIESLSIYPIKSCGAFSVPNGKRWEIRREGLAWDREWCLIHQGTGATLNQKKYPRMALIRPFLDLDRNVLRITCGEPASPDQKVLEVSLSQDETNLVSTSVCQRTSKASTVCGDQVTVQAYSSPTVSKFFSDFLGVPCTLARLPPQSSTRHASPKKPPGAWRQYLRKFVMPGSFPQDASPSAPEQNPILLSNESPILLISRSSVNHLNENIKAKQKKKRAASKAVAADVFRANIVVAESLAQLPRLEQPYVEDHWESVEIGPGHLQFDVLGSCQRCSMVCIDQFTGVRRDEPFSTLAKTRKINGKIVFGRHVSLSSSEVTQDGLDATGRWTLMVGDTVTPSYTHE